MHLSSFRRTVLTATLALLGISVVGCGGGSDPISNPGTLRFRATALPAGVYAKQIDNNGRILVEEPSGLDYLLASAAPEAPRTPLLPYPADSVAAQYASPADMNEVGQIIGLTTEPSTGIMTAFLSEGGAITDLPLLPYSRQSSVEAINESGQAVGECYINNPNGARAVIWSNGEVREIGVFEGPEAEGRSWANDINARGDVVGTVELPGATDVTNAVTRAFQWRDGVMTDLGVLNGARSSVGHRINDAGVVVGTSGGRPFIYENGRMQDGRSVFGADIDVIPYLNNRGDMIGAVRGETIEGQSPGVSTPATFYLRTGGQTYRLADVLPDELRGEHLQILDMNDRGELIANVDGGKPSTRYYVLTPEY